MDNEDGLADVRRRLWEEEIAIERRTYARRIRAELRESQRAFERDVELLEASNRTLPMRVNHQHRQRLVRMQRRAERLLNHAIMRVEEWMVMMDLEIRRYETGDRTHTIEWILEDFNFTFARFEKRNELLELPKTIIDNAHRLALGDL